MILFQYRLNVGKIKWPFDLRFNESRRPIFQAQGCPCILNGLSYIAILRHAHYILLSPRTCKPDIGSLPNLVLVSYTTNVSWLKHVPRCPSLLFPEL